jgi:topoisomerase-4 subunit A
LSYKVSDAGNSFPDDELNVEEFIGIKSYKAKGKRLSTREIDSFQFLEPFEPEPSEEAPEVPEPVEGPNTPETPENTEKIKVNPADVPMEVVKPQGDGIQMDLFDNE